VAARALNYLLTVLNMEVKVRVVVPLVTALLGTVRV
jgi:hypothetical protein